MIRNFGLTSVKSILKILVIYALVILVVSYIASSSLNPLEVYASDRLWAKILVSLFAFFIAAMLLQLLGLYAMGKAIEVTTHKPAEDVICPGCGLPLIPYMSSHGPPIMCPNPKCTNQWWHNGPMCFNKDLPNGGIFHLCPHCRSATSGDEDLYSDLGE